MRKELKEAKVRVPRKQTFKNVQGLAIENNIALTKTIDTQVKHAKTLPELVAEIKETGFNFE